MSLLHHVTVLVHMVAALLWLGGMATFALLAPVLRTIPDEGTRQQIFHRLGERFRLLGWLCLAVLLLTGVMQLRLRGWWGADLLGAPEFWRTALGSDLFGKLAAVTVMVAVQAVHDFWLGPRAGSAEAGSEEARTRRRRAALLARMNVFVGLVLLYFAVALARGG
jgi:putative copper resistance protein D